MALENIVAKDGRFMMMSMAPDVCLTPGKSGKPIPYPIMDTLESSKQCSPNVFLQGQPVFMHNQSYANDVTGDEPGKGGGIISTTQLEISHSIDKSPSVFVNGYPIVRTADMVWMNWEDPGGADVAGSEKTKAERYKERKDLIAAGKASDDAEVKEAAERLDRNNNAVEKAKLAQNTYSPEDGAPEGWTNISNDPEKLAEYGLRPRDLEKPGSEFRAQVYEPDPAVFGKDMKPTVAFKGTTPTSMQDWKNNGQQGIGAHSEYYENAVSIGRSIKESGQEVDIAGHSLGAGLGAAASSASGMPAMTYNGAGLKSGTVAKYGGTPQSSKIQNFRVAGEFLTGAQETGWRGALGSAGAGLLIGGPVGALAGLALKFGSSALMADAVGTQYELPGTGLNPIDRHGMVQVIDGLEAQKAEDQATIKQDSAVNMIPSN